MADTDHIRALRLKEAKEDSQSRNSNGKAAGIKSSVTSFATGIKRQTVKPKSASAPDMFTRKSSSLGNSRGLQNTRKASFAK